MGDHTESSASYDWSYSIDLAEHATTTLASVESVCHLGCTNVKPLDKGKTGAMFWHGKPVDGHGGKRDGAGSGLDALLKAIKGGMKHKDLADAFPDLHARYHTWCERMMIAYQHAPMKSLFDHADMCKHVGLTSIPCDHPDGQHPAVVVGNPGL